MDIQTPESYQHFINFYDLHIFLHEYQYQTMLELLISAYLKGLSVCRLKTMLCILIKSYAFGGGGGKGGSRSTLNMNADACASSL